MTATSGQTGETTAAGECPLCGGRTLRMTGELPYCAPCDRSFDGGFYPDPVGYRPNSEKTVELESTAHGLRSTAECVTELVPSPSAWVDPPSFSDQETSFPLAEGALDLWSTRSETFRRTLPPRVVSEQHPRFLERVQAHVPAPYVLSMSHGRVWGPEGAVVDRANRLVADVSNRALGRAPQDHPVFTHDTLIPPRSCRAAWPCSRLVEERATTRTGCSTFCLGSTPCEPRAGSETTIFCWSTHCVTGFRLRPWRRWA